MKRLENIKAEINSLLTAQHKTSKASNAAKKKLKFLTIVRNFLETNPPEEHVKNAINVVTHNLEVIRGYRKNWQAPKDTNPKDHNSIFNKEFGVPKLNNQLKMMQYILDDN